jgi:hypothetical protein
MALETNQACPALGSGNRSDREGASFIGSGPTGAAIVREQQVITGAQHRFFATNTDGRQPVLELRIDQGPVIPRVIRTQKYPFLSEGDGSDDRRQCDPSSVDIKIVPASPTTMKR